MQRWLKYIILMVMLSYAYGTEAQIDNYWASGRYGGLDFNYSPPQVYKSSIYGFVDYTGDTIPARYSSTISDCNGNLLFYTSGNQVWDSKHSKMPNGLMFNTTYLGIKNISMPVPNKDDTYYIFYNCFIGGASSCQSNKERGLYYSVVDMSLNSDYGDVDTSLKNKIVMDADIPFNHSTKMAVTPHINNEKWWLVAYLKDNRLHSFLIGDNGVEDTVVNHGFNAEAPQFTSGELTFTNDGENIISTYLDYRSTQTPVAIMYDFDRSTGLINPNYKDLLNLPNSWSGSSSMSAHTSPNDSFIYITTYKGYSSGGIYRVNRFASDPHQTKELIKNGIYRGISLGPDNKLYINANTDRLDVIHRPNESDMNDIQYESNYIKFEYPQEFSGFSLPTIPFPVTNIEFGYKNNQCKDTTIFNNLSDEGIKEQEWYFRKVGDSLPFDTIYDKEPKYVFPADGEYIVTLNGIDSTEHPAACHGRKEYIDTIDISLPARAGFLQDTIKYACNEATLHLKDTSLNAETVLYDFGDSNFTDTNAHTYDSSGTYVLRQAVESAKGCTDTITDSVAIIIEPPPDAGFAMTDSVSCRPALLPVQDSSVNADSLRWLVNDIKAGTGSTPATIIDSPGTYDLSLIAYNAQGCPDTLARPEALTVIERPDPAISYSRDTLCGAQQTEFIAEYNNAQSFSWHIADTTVSNADTLNHTYTDSGQHEVLLTATNEQCADTASVIVDAPIEPFPQASFHTPDTGFCTPHTVKLSNTSIDAKQYHWKIDGPENFATEEHSPEIEISEPGKYDIQLIASNNQGCADTLIREQYIEALPPAEAGFTTADEEGCEHVRFYFENHSQHADHWHWDFGDGETDTGSERYHIYREEGFYNIMQVASNQYCSDTVYSEESIEIVPAPRPEFSLSDTAICTSGKIEVTNEATGDIANIFYSTSRGDTVYSEDAEFTFTVADTFKVYQHLESSTGCTPKDSQQVVVLEQPVADFEVTDTTKSCGEETWHVTDASAHNSETFWDLDIAEPDSGTNTLLHFSRDSTYSLQQVARHHHCSDTLTRELEVTIRPEPELEFHAPDTIACLPGDVEFVNQTEHADKFTWDFGKGDNITLENTEPVTERYTESGIYTIVLAAESEEDCRDTLTRQYYINIVDSVTADFDLTPQAGCQPLEVSFTNHSHTADRELNYNWHFDNGDSSTEVNPIHTYQDLQTGNYEVVLSADNDVCSDTARASVNISGYDGQDDAPEMHSATVEDDQVQLQWHGEEEADYYNIYRERNGQMTRYSETEDTLWYDSRSEPSEQVYHYRIEAQDTCGNSSAKSLMARNILLQGDQEDNERALLSWNHYEEWFNGVSEYIVERRPVEGDFEVLQPVQNINYVDEDYFREHALGFCYRVQAIESGGAAFSYSNVLCLPFESVMFVPNAFSPNDDELNDKFEIRGTGIESFELKIFNRWGSLLYESDDMNESWDGHVDGERVPEGIYLYSIQATGKDHQIHNRQGSVLVVW